MHRLFILVAALGGGALAAQAGANARLAAAVGGPTAAALVSVALSTLLLGLYVGLGRQPLPAPERLAALPWWGWVGGVLGVAVLVSITSAAPRLGAAVTLASVIAGQLTTATLLDHFGLLGFPEHRLTPTRIAGVLLLAAGVALVARR